MSLYGKLEGAAVSSGGRVGLNSKVALLIKYLVVATAIEGLTVIYPLLDLREWRGEDLFLIARILSVPLAGIVLLLLLLFRKQVIFAVVLVVSGLLRMLFFVPVLLPSVVGFGVFDYYRENFPFALQLLSWIPWVSVFPAGLFVHEALPFSLFVLQGALELGIVFWLLVRTQANQAEVMLK